MGAAFMRPSEAFAALARETAERHTAWNSPHRFGALLWDGATVRVGSLSMIDPGIDIDPDALVGLAERDVNAAPDPTAVCGYLLTVEGHSVAQPGPDASEHERRRYEADRVGRTFHARADAEEIMVVFVVDLYERLWVVTKRRSSPDDLVAVFEDVGAAPRYDGPLVRTLRGVAHATRKAMG